MTTTKKTTTKTPETKSKTTPKATTPRKKPSTVTSPIEKEVDRLLETIKFIDAIHDSTRTKSSVELGSKPHPQGSQKYSLLVENKGAFIQIALTETFINVHKAATVPSQKYIAMFSVPITDKTAYDKLCLRFFNMDMNNNVNVASQLIDKMATVLE